MKSGLKLWAWNNAQTMLGTMKIEERKVRRRAGLSFKALKLEPVQLPLSAIITTTTHDVDLRRSSRVPPTHRVR